MIELRRVVVTFSAEEMEISATYAHDAEPATPGTKTRTATAARMAAAGLERALEGLGTGVAAVWGGYSTDTRISTDKVIVEHRKASEGSK
jgi:hypothetical protein